MDRYYAAAFDPDDLSLNTEYSGNDCDNFDHDHNVLNQQACIDKRLKSGKS